MQFSVQVILSDDLLVIVTQLKGGRPLACRLNGVSIPGFQMRHAWRWSRGSVSAPRPEFDLVCRAIGTATNHDSSCARV